MRGFSTSELMIVKTAVFAPIPNARTRAATTVKPR